MTCLFFLGVCFLRSKRYILPISAPNFFETCLQLFFDIVCFLLWLFFCTSYNKWNSSKQWGYYENTMQTNFWMYAFCTLHIPKNGLTFNSNILHRFFNRNPLNELSSCPHIPTKKNWAVFASPRNTHSTTQGLYKPSKQLKPTHRYVPISRSLQVWKDQLTAQHLQSSLQHATPLW